MTPSTPVPYGNNIMLYIPRLGEVQRMWRVAELKKVLAAYERNDLWELCEISDVIWEWDMVFEGEWDSSF